LPVSPFDLSPLSGKPCHSSLSRRCRSPVVSRDWQSRSSTELIFDASPDGLPFFFPISISPPLCSCPCFPLKASVNRNLRWLMAKGSKKGIRSKHRCAHPFLSICFLVLFPSSLPSGQVRRSTPPAWSDATKFSQRHSL